VFSENNLLLNISQLGVTICKDQFSFIKSILSFFRCVSWTDIITSKIYVFSSYVKEIIISKLQFKDIKKELIPYIVSETTFFMKNLRPNLICVNNEFLNKDGIVIYTNQHIDRKWRNILCYLDQQQN